ncbi:MAG: flap endonuclease-1 [Candidatus Micrarchaeaceae archaeon]
MAVDISRLVNKVKRNIEIEALNGKRIAIDAYNAIYQFLTIIRQPDGTPLIDSNGRITSHLSGLFYRTINLVEKGIKPVYVFDGIPPILKSRTLEARMNRREEAKKKLGEALSRGDIEEARKYATESTGISKEVVSESKELLRLMGIPFVQAPGEGEAEAASMVIDGAAYAVGSQDYDSFLFGAKKVIRNLSITGRRKLPKKNIFINIGIEEVDLEELLRSFGIDRRRLVWIGILIGNDFIEGIKGIGPMKALKIVKEHDSLEEIRNYVKNALNAELGDEIYEVEKIFMEPEVEKIGKEEIEKKEMKMEIDEVGLLRFMVKEHNFSEEKVKKYIDILKSKKYSNRQRGIEDYLR